MVELGGTNTPTETLDVNGTIKVSGGLQVSSGGTFRSTRLLTVSISTATTLTEASMQEDIYFVQQM